MIELHVIFFGLVQGVGFRRTIFRYAQQHHFVGTVQNLEDGSVELVIQGQEKEINEFVDLICQNCNPGKVDRVVKTTRPIQQKSRKFQVLC